MGSNRTATEGDQVTFQCLAAGWSPAAQLSWTVNSVPVDNVPYNVSSNGTLMNSNSTLKITAQNNATINCLASISALPSPAISTVYLTVRKRLHNVHLYSVVERELFFLNIQIFWLVIILRTQQASFISLKLCINIFSSKSNKKNDAGFINISAMWIFLAVMRLQ